MRILYIHCSRGYLGDAIRTSKVYSFLKKGGIRVHEKRIDIKDPRSFLLALTGLRYFLLSRENSHETKHLHAPLEVLVVSFLNSIQRRIMEEATIVKPHAIVAETSLAGYFSLTSKRKLGIPLITDVHGLVGAESKNRASKYAQILSTLERITFHESEYLLTVSKQMKQQICLEHKLQTDKVLVVPNGGNVQRFQARFSLPLNVIYAGNFAAYERVSDFLEIAKAVGQTSPFVFFLMGDGIQKREILSRMNKERIRIKFLGLKTRQEALRILSKMQVGVVTSTSGLERRVAFPIKVLDYMSCGLPVVAPKIGDWGQLIEKEDCGIVIDENRVTEFVKALHALCDEEEWTRKSRNGKECIEREYRWNLVLEPLSDLMMNIAD